MGMKIAITREVSRSIIDCELTYHDREPIDVERARVQHAQYQQALRDLGLTVIALQEEPDLPDAVFVEDTALVLDECAVITRPGAPSRRAETESIAQALSPYRRLHRILSPGHIDGGDILRIDRAVYVGKTGRTNEHAVRQIREILSPHGYTVETVSVSGCLHLKSAATLVAPGTLLVNPDWVEREKFRHVEYVEVDPSEPRAANALVVNHTVLFPTGYPKTCARLRDAGLGIQLIETGELAKAEGGLTCCSLILEA